MVYRILSRITVGMVGYEKFFTKNWPKNIDQNFIVEAEKVQARIIRLTGLYKILVVLSKCALTKKSLYNEQFNSTHQIRSGFSP